MPEAVLSVGGEQYQDGGTRGPTWELLVRWRVPEFLLRYRCIAPRGLRGPGEDMVCVKGQLASSPADTSHGMTLSDDLDAHGHHESGEHSSDSFTTVNHSKNATYKRRAGKVKGKGAERTVPERLASRRETLERTGYLADFTSASLELDQRSTGIGAREAHTCLRGADLLKQAFAPKDHEERIEAKPGGRHSCPLPSCVVCLGLGSIAESSKSQDQYILLQTLLDELGVAVRLSLPRIKFSLLI